MTSFVVLDSEIHANTRRTRITYSGWVGDRKAAVKCFKGPLFGFYHWLRAHYKTGPIRRVAFAFPEVLFSGWVPEKRCFCIGFEFLEGYAPVRELVQERSAASLQVIEQLLDLLVDCHRAGVEQTDANLTNFLHSDTGKMAIVDEDDVKLHGHPLRESAALFNLAAVVSRLQWRTAADVRYIWEYYSARSDVTSSEGFERFSLSLLFWEQRLQAKLDRAKAAKSKSA